MPKQYSIGGSDKLSHKTKKGNLQIRRLLVAGAMSMIIPAKQDGFTRHYWLVRLLERKPTKVAAIALANKMGRMIWALLIKGGTFIPARLVPYKTNAPSTAQTSLVRAKEIMQKLKLKE